MIGIIDYKVVNLFSIENAIRKITDEVIVSSCPDDLREVDGLIFPGVGSFDHGMNALEGLGLDIFIQEKAKENTPILGICMGMQLLFSYGHEGLGRSGLGILKGSVEKLSSNKNSRVPHMGWNDVYGYEADSKLFSGIQHNSSFYFVHSYHATVENQENCIYTDFYGSDIVAGISQNNIYGVQFHPEKSQDAGMRLLRNFVKLTEQIEC